MNANTIANGLKPSGIITLSNPSALTLFQYAPSTLAVGDNPGTLLPALLDIPSQPSLVYSATGTSGSGAGLVPASSLSGVALPSYEEWTCDGRPFIVRVNGLVQPLQTSRTFTLDLYWGNGLAVANAGGIGGVSVYNLTATLPSANPFASNFNVETICLWDSQSNTLNTYTYGNICGTLVSGQVLKITNVAPGQVQFVCGASLNDTAVGQGTNTFTITLKDFSADMD